MGDDCHGDLRDWGDVLDVEADYQLGHDVTVPPAPAGLPSSAGGMGPRVDAVWSRFTRPAACTVTFWAEHTGCVVFIETYVGNTRTRKAFPAPLVPTVVQVYGRSIVVSFAATAGGGGGGATAHASLTPGSVDPLNNVMPLWVPSSGVLGAQGSIFAGVAQGESGAGVMLSVSGFLTPNLATSVGGQTYLMFFDSVNNPGNGVAPLIAIGPLSPGEAFGFDQMVRPQVRFATGLFWALSTTPDVLTLATLTAGGVRVDAGVAV